jgi:hypothetical protein
MSSKWQGEPKRWRVRGKAPSDGLVVTLGRYDTEDEARTACDSLTRDGTYRNITVEAIILPIPAPTPGSPDNQASGTSTA